jgi:hypothetical protein
MQRGDERERDERGDRLADDADEEGQDRDATPQPGGRQLADVGGDEVQVGADPHAGDEAEHDEHGQALGGRVAEGADRGEHDRHNEHAEAADPVGEPADDDRADRVADEADGEREERRLVAGEAELRLDLRQREADVGDVVEGEEVARADDRQVEPGQRPHRDPVLTGEDERHPSLVGCGPVQPLRGSGMRHVRPVPVQTAI